MKSYKSPKALVERIAELYAQRKQYEALAEAIGKEEHALLEQAVGLFTEKAVPQVVLASGHKLAIVTQPIATVNDWKALIADVANHYGDERWQGVVHKRVSPTAIEKLAFANVFVSGVVLARVKVAAFTAPRGKKA